MCMYKTSTKQKLFFINFTKYPPNELDRWIINLILKQSENLNFCLFIENY